MASSASRPTITATETTASPAWALEQRRLMNRLEDAAGEFVARYTREDGTLTWRDRWPGMDGSDDPYEAFMYLALLYSLGGSESIYRSARRLWDAITWQWTQYGQIEREFDGYYDWMHHGEANLFHYFFGLTKPDSLVDRQRAKSFTRMYDGSDPLAQNYDTELHLIRAPQTGSRGPRFVVTAEDLSTHRGVLDDYPAPFEDMVTSPYSLGTCNWSNDEVFAEVIEKMNQRTTRGDVPLNLNATTQFTHAYLYSGEAELKTWVLEYLATWKARADVNGGILPDNVGLSGEVGEYLDGKWWGGHYGWRWPHGLTFTIIEPVLNAVSNALLITGDENQLALLREQLDYNFAIGRDENGLRMVPHKHVDAGWTDYRAAHPFHPIHLWARSMAEEDLERVERIPRAFDWAEVVVPRVPFATKHYNANTVAWFEYVSGRNPGYPDRILEANHELVDQQLRRLRSDEGDPSNWGSVRTIDGYAAKGNVHLQTDGYAIHAWQEFNPVYFESLVQLMWGAPMHISHGGLQHAAVRYFDADARRPGLPADVAALVSRVSRNSVSLELVNTGGTRRTVVIQAGSFREHRILSAVLTNGEGAPESVTVDSEWLDVVLAPHATARIELEVARFANDPSYETPFSSRDDWAPLITGRTPG